MGQTVLPPSILPRTSALVRMLGSPVDAEALAAVRALGRTLAGAGCDFHNLADRIGQGPERIEVEQPRRRPTQPPRSSAPPGGAVLWKAARRQAVAERLRAGLHSRAFTSWEAKFAADVAEMIETGGQRRFSSKQISTAEELAAKVMYRSGRT